MGELEAMKVKRDDTEESRKYWEFLEENSKIVENMPWWKRGIEVMKEKTNITGTDQKCCVCGKITTISKQYFFDKEYGGPSCLHTGMI